MSDTTISRFKVPELNEMPEDIKQRILVVQEKAGFIPNIFLALAHRPDEFRAFFSYHDALMEKSDGLTKAEREMIVVATSGINQCTYLSLHTGLYCGFGRRTHSSLTRLLPTIEKLI